MQATVENFKFSKTLQSLKKYALEGYAIPKDPPEHFLKQFMLDLPQYMERFFTQDFKVSAETCARMHKIPARSLPDLPNKGDPPQSQFMDVADREYFREQKMFRPTVQYALTKDEMKEARRYLKTNKELERAISGLQACLISYFSDLEKALGKSGYISKKRISQKLPNDFEADFLAFKSESSGFSFMHDLLPIMALTLSREDNEGAVITEQQLGKSLCNAFRMQAFQSKRMTYGNGAKSGIPIVRNIRCPFGVLATRIFSIGFEESHDGSLIAQENLKPGALLHFIMKRYRELEYPQAVEQSYG